MKNFYSLALAMIMALATGVAVVACGDDDNDAEITNGNDSRLFGTWYCTIYEVWEYKNDVLMVHWIDFDDETVRLYTIVDGKETGEYNDIKRGNNDHGWDEITFNSDGSFTSINSDNENSRGTYAASKGALTITTDGVSLTRKLQYELQYELNEGQLIIISHDRDNKDDEGYSYDSKNYYKKGSYPGK